MIMQEQCYTFSSRARKKPPVLWWCGSRRRHLSRPRLAAVSGGGGNMCGRICVLAISSGTSSKLLYSSPCLLASFPARCASQ